MPLDARFLPEKTRSLFDRLIEDPLMRGMTLVGGSALALQIGHRMSEDLDFAVFGPKIPAARIDALMAGLEKEGRLVSLLTPQSSIERFKINTGKRLLDYARRGLAAGKPVDELSAAPGLPAFPDHVGRGTRAAFSANVRAACEELGGS